MARNLDVYGNYCRINWVKVLFDIEDGKIAQCYYEYKETRPYLSSNRCAYYVIKKRVSTTTLQKFIGYVKKQLPGVAICCLKNDVNFKGLVSRKYEC